MPRRTAARSAKRHSWPHTQTQLLSSPLRSRCSLVCCRESVLLWILLWHGEWFPSGSSPCRLRALRQLSTRNGVTHARTVLRLCRHPTLPIFVALLRAYSRKLLGPKKKIGQALCTLDAPWRVGPERVCSQNRSQEGVSRARKLRKSARTLHFWPSLAPHKCAVGSCSGPKNR